MYKFNESTKVYQWEDRNKENEFSFKIIGKPHYAQAYRDFSECLLYNAIDLITKEKFTVYIFRLNPQEWDYMNPEF